MERLFLALLVTVSLAVPGAFLAFGPGGSESWDSLPVMDSARKKRAENPGPMENARAEGYLAEARRELSAAEREDGQAALERACALIAQARSHDTQRAEPLWRSHCEGR